ncbi:alcohol dehydrogenase catalytic domain-containing protein [Aeromicrobium endophyticum]|uniref:Alcohol dehydrogenase n=1 Tax=Aeromicrobium endophyticum TaxID=2292704 RepID=A0A371NYX8_9ACTN|nr:alcohol dehydrogenase catalytic domain-containing protein [Aeromicrobium endophyticum]REK68895.1 alcohol dehydrogenase [Aeromicrobium endophyticum]
MRAVVIEGPGSIAVHELPDPTPGPGDVVVAVRAAGICGTDIHLLDGELPYDSYPIVPGHEFYGEVVATGADVDPAWLNRIVTVDPNMPCRACPECRRGRANLCERYEALGVTTDGAAAELVRVPSTLAYVLPPDVSDVGALLTEPLACAIHGVDMLPRHPQDRYLVYGAGTMGLMMSLLAADLTNEQVTVVELNPARRALAESFGFRAVASPDEIDPDARWETVVDCTGAVAAIEDGLGRVRRGGAFQCFGVADPAATIKVSPFDVYRDEITIVGSMAVQNSFDRASRLAQTWGDDKLGPLVTHGFALDEYSQAVDTFRGGTGLKIAIRPGGAS